MNATSARLSRSPPSAPLSRCCQVRTACCTSPRCARSLGAESRECRGCAQRRTEDPGRDQRDRRSRQAVADSRGRGDGVGVAVVPTFVSADACRSARPSGRRLPQLDGAVRRTVLPNGLRSSLRTSGPPAPTPWASSSRSARGTRRRASMAPHTSWSTCSSRELRLARPSRSRPRSSPWAASSTHTRPRSTPASTLACCTVTLSSPSTCSAT